MSAIQDRGAIRWEWDGDELVIYADADKLIATDVFDAPEVEVLRIHKDDMKRAASKAWVDTKRAAIKAGKDISAEWKRFQKRRLADPRKK